MNNNLQQDEELQKSTEYTAPTIINEQQEPFDEQLSETNRKHELKNIYFTYKLTKFFILLTFSGVLLPFLVPCKTSIRWIICIVSLIVFGFITFICNETHREQTGYSAMDNNTEKIYKDTFIGAKIFSILEIIVNLLLVYHFFVDLSDFGFWIALKAYVRTLLINSIICTGFWTFKIGGLIVALTISVILEYIPIYPGYVSVLDLYNRNSSETSNETIDETSDDTQSEYVQEESLTNSYHNKYDVEITNAFLGRSSGRDTIVITYTWTNTTNSNSSAIYNVSLKAYQGNIALEQDFFAKEDQNMALREIRPDTSIEITEVFYLDDSYSDVTVEITPWLNTEDIICASKVFSII